ncbi:LacI family DNA-binding transcriptional regulator [Tessaracoccus antarcticus]|uniref:LacI family transcriptional regulator n=1 Tax=Tessaracoccus antarcticus TaxID=2479848 RepID=A0A3M0G9J7_9ACTN|nr:LacI family DNA-binding transcriptional regulator [Tessaracoccus antarcticus]RMB61681.1 LacI family transcriptional regulator [Tessaracoccus antarcticus]
MSDDGVREPRTPHVHVSSTMEDVAAAAGVSRTSVSRVMLGQKKVSEETRRRVFAAAEHLGYVPNVLASELASRGTSTVGLLLRDASNPAYGLLFTRLQEAAHAADLTLVTMTINADDQGRRQVAGLHRLMGLRVAGLIVATGGVTSHQLEPFHSQIPIIRAGRPETTSLIHAVSYDEVHAGRSLAHCVADAGHREVAVLATAEDVSFPEYVRSTTMAATLVGRGVEVISVPLGDDAHDGVGAAVALARDGRVGAIMCPSDLRQLQVLRALAAVGLTAPADVSVSGCDGVLPGADLLGLTTYRIPVEELAVRTVARMSDLLSQEPTPGVVAERLRGALVRGRTVGPPSPRKAS